MKSNTSKSAYMILAAILLLLAIIILSAPTQAAEITQQTTTTSSYGWEDGGTILGSSGNLTRPSNVPSGTGGVTAHGGNSMLQVTEEPNSGTPQAYLAYVEGLSNGDIVTASFYGWDTTPSDTPRLRIWGHYAVSNDISSYEGSASGNSTYTDGNGWEQVSYEWTFDDDSGTRDALVIEARLYSSSGTTPDFLIDDISVTAPDGASITFPTTNATHMIIDGGAIMLAGVNIENNSGEPCSFTSIKYPLPPGGLPSDPGELPLQWNITSTGCASLNTDLTFVYSEIELTNGNNINESNLDVFKNSSGNANDWISQSGTLDTTKNTITVNGVTSLSSWTIGDNITAGNSDPTAVSLQSFTGQSSATPILLITTLLVLLLGSTLFIWQRKRQ